MRPMPPRFLIFQQTKRLKSVFGWKFDTPLYCWVFKSKGSDGSIIETPSDILKKRYAKGEIDKEEFEQKKKDLES